MYTEADFKEFKPQLKYLKLYLMFQDLSRRLIKPVFGGFETLLKFIKFGLGKHQSKKENPINSVQSSLKSHIFWLTL